MLDFRQHRDLLLAKKKTKLELAQDNAQVAISETNKTIEKLGVHTNSLYESLTTIQDLFNKI